MIAISQENISADFNAREYYVYGTPHLVDVKEETGWQTNISLNCSDKGYKCGTNGGKVRRISSRIGAQQKLLRLLEDLMRTSLIPAKGLQS